MRFGFVADCCSAFNISWKGSPLFACAELMLMSYRAALHSRRFDFFENLRAKKKRKEEGSWVLSVQTGQTWWVHAKVISPTIHFCQGVSLGNSPKCGNSLGTDWCRRVKKAESECVLKWVCMCVCALGANSSANKRKLLLSNSALVCSDGMSPVGSSNASSITWKFGHQISSKTWLKHVIIFTLTGYLLIRQWRNFHPSSAWRLEMLHKGWAMVSVVFLSQFSFRRFSWFGFMLHSCHLINTLCHSFTKASGSD